jgi:hypothetical protein
VFVEPKNKGKPAKHRYFPHENNTIILYHQQPLSMGEPAIFGK